MPPIFVCTVCGCNFWLEDENAQSSKCSACYLIGLGFMAGDGMVNFLGQMTFDGSNRAKCLLTFTCTACGYTWEPAAGEYHGVLNCPKCDATFFDTDGRTILIDGGSVRTSILTHFAKSPE